MLASLLALSLAVTPPAAEVTAPAQEVKDTSSLPWIGVTIDAGAPDGVGTSVAFRPARWIRIEGGGITNGFAAGLRASTTFVPLHALVSPSLTFTFGGFWAGNANGLARTLIGDAGFHSGFLERVSYRFAEAQLGLEIGSGRRFLFFIHGGYSRIWMTDASFSQGLQQLGGATYQSTPMSAQLTVPSGKLGVAVFFG